MKRHAPNLYGDANPFGPWAGKFWTVIMDRRATLHEMQTVYTIDDMADMAEAIALDAAISREANRKQGVR